jgi:hypothetical protein
MNGIYLKNLASWKKPADTSCHSLRVRVTKPWMVYSDGPREIIVGGEMRKLIAEKVLPAEA